jgi:hypothetical protein
MLRYIVAISIGMTSTALAETVQQDMSFEACQQSLQPNGSAGWVTVQDTPDVKQVQVTVQGGTMTATCTRADSKLTLTPQ